MSEFSRELEAADFKVMKDTVARREVAAGMLARIGGPVGDFEAREMASRVVAAYIQMAEL